jgi:hypothetical protein
VFQNEADAALVGPYDRHVAVLILNDGYMSCGDWTLGRFLYEDASPGPKRVCWLMTQKVSQKWEVNRQGDATTLKTNGTWHVLFSRDAY